jgi:ubiquinone/menaquinone biosynthesis C-methylase UbiE
MNPQQSYDRVARDYAEHIAGELAHKPFDRQILQHFAHLARDIPGGRHLPVLDLGCGPGHITRYLHDLGVPIIGVDISPGMLAEAHRLHPDLPFREGDMRALTWPDASIAAIAVPYSILHIPCEDVVAVLGELRRVLVPTGCLYLSFHIGNEMRHRDDWWDKPVDLDFIFFETAEMEGYLRAARFREIETLERDPYPDVEVQTRRAYIFARR